MLLVLQINLLLLIRRQSILPFAQLLLEFLENVLLNILLVTMLTYLPEVLLKLLWVLTLLLRALSTYALPTEVASVQ
jgi:hypothetical protein